MALKGLNSFKNTLQKHADRQASFDRPKVDYFSLKGSPKVDVQFLQELDETADNYNAEKGTAVLSTEYSFWGNGQGRTIAADPEGGVEDFATRSFKEIRRLSREDEAFKEKYSANLTTFLYITLLADIGEGPKRYLLKRNAMSAGLLETLVEHHETYGSITNCVYRIKKPAGKNSSWTLERLPESKFPPVDATDIPTYDSESLIPKIEDDEQQVKYLGPVLPEQKSEAPAAATATPAVQSSSDDW